MRLISRLDTRRWRASHSKTVWILACLAVLVYSGSGLALFGGASTQAASLAQSSADGQAIFNQKCAACHTIGGGRLVGPDLQGVTQRRDLDWLRSFITGPDQMIASGDPTAEQLLAENNNIPMPNLSLTDAEVDALMAYLENPDGAAQAVAVPPALAVPLPPDDPALGQNTFTGARPLSNGGTACIACHSVEGVASLGGGNLGPDLTHVFQRYGDAGLASALQTLPFPTMQGVFGTRPLTPAEQADLHAFFQQVDGQVGQPRAFTAWFWAVGAIGAAVLFGMMVFFWPRQRQSLSEQLRRSA